MGAPPPLAYILRERWWRWSDSIYRCFSASLFSTQPRSQTPRRSNQTVLLRTSFENVWKIWRCRHVCSSTAMALFLRSGLAPATMNMQSAPTERKSESQKEKSVSTVAHLSVHERSSCDCDSRARHDVGTHRLNGRGLATARQLAHIIQRCR